MRSALIPWCTSMLSEIIAAFYFTPDQLPLVIVFSTVALIAGLLSRTFLFHL